VTPPAAALVLRRAAHVVTRHNPANPQGPEGPNRFVPNFDPETPAFPVHGPGTTVRHLENRTDWLGYDVHSHEIRRACPYSTAPVRAGRVQVGSPPLAILRNVGSGLLAMAVTYLIGLVVGTHVA